jgi:CheY-like chemotaxis protein
MRDKLRVLYVDDEPGLLEIGKMFLEQVGEFSVVTIYSASSALDLLKQERFDVIISDYQMPGMDGIQFLIEVRTKFGQVPFILFTGKGREEVVIQAINSGADFYLQKGGVPGAQFAELAHKIRQATFRRQAEEDLANAQILLIETFEQSPVPMVLVSMPDGIIRIMNLACREFLGIMDEPSAIGTQLLNFRPPTKTLIRKEERDRSKIPQLHVHCQEIKRLIWREWS